MWQGSKGHCSFLYKKVYSDIAFNSIFLCIRIAMQKWSPIRPQCRSHLFDVKFKSVYQKSKCIPFDKVNLQIQLNLYVKQCRYITKKS